MLVATCCVTCVCVCHAQYSLKSTPPPSTTSTSTDTDTPHHILTLKRTLSPVSHPIASIISAAHTIHHNAPRTHDTQHTTHTQHAHDTHDIYAHSPARVTSLSDASFYSTSPAVSDWTRESVSEERSGECDAMRVTRMSLCAPRCFV